MLCCDWLFKDFIIFVKIIIYAGKTMYYSAVSNQSQQGQDWFTLNSYFCKNNGNFSGPITVLHGYSHKNNKIFLQMKFAVERYRYNICTMYLYSK